MGFSYLAKAIKFKGPMLNSFSDFFIFWAWIQQSHCENPPETPENQRTLNSLCAASC